MSKAICPHCGSGKWVGALRLVTCRFFGHKWSTWTRGVPDQIRECERCWLVNVRLSDEGTIDFMKVLTQPYSEWRRTNRGPA